MTVDSKFDGKLCQAINRTDELSQSGGSEERVKDQHPVLADDKAGIA